MKYDECVVCGSQTDLQQHHIEPVVWSGRNRHKKKRYNGQRQLENATVYDCFARLFDLGVITDDGEITLCGFHHNIMHGIVKFQRAEQSKLIKEGVRKAQERGVKFGRPTNVNEGTVQEIITLTTSGLSVRKIAKKLEIGVGTYYKLMKEYNINESRII